EVVNRSHGTSDDAFDSGGDDFHVPSDKNINQPPPSLDSVWPTNSSERGRKRKSESDNLGGGYLHRPLEENAKEEENTKKRKKMTQQQLYTIAKTGFQDAVSNEVFLSPEIDDSNLGEKKDTTQSVAPQDKNFGSLENDLGLEKASRTVFLGNVSTLCIRSRSAKKTLMNHLTSFAPSLPPHNISHRIESFRFRSTAFSSNLIPKRIAYAKQCLMESTTKSTNAYVVYKTKLAAQEAVKKLNGTSILDRHLRVDSVTHPAQTKHRRCVFVGNLGFTDDENTIDNTIAKDTGKIDQKTKQPADLEEGLWRHFGKAGKIESVRVVRDKHTRVGKGIAYVQFQNENAVEKALLFDGKKFPPMLPRKLRVTRARNIEKNASHRKGGRTLDSKPLGVHIPERRYMPKVSRQAKSVSRRRKRPQRNS
ncbi:MAG: hypothetical protein Q9214_007291, partial [Letrouitia sp. 1 TL-2023]